MSRADLAIVGGEVVTTHPFPATVLVRAGRIEGLQTPGAPVDARTVIDARGMQVLPGIIDIHFHSRDPSYPHRGDFASETRAAAAGGVTSVFEMPISKPCTATLERWLHRRDIAAAKAHVNIGLYAAPGLLDAADVRAMVDAGAIGFKLFTTASPPGREDEFDGLATTGPAHVLQAFEMIAGYGLRCVVHAEEQSLLELYTARARARTGPDFLRHNASRPPVVEAVAAATVVQLALATGCPVHIAHVTSAATLDVVRHAKRVGAPVTAETCPHYLFCSEGDLAQAGPFGVINPPIRCAADREALWAALEDGTLDVVATDHAPFARHEKEAALGDVLSAPPGHPGVETLLPLLMTAVAEGRLTLERVVELISERPARLFGLYPFKGVLAPGSDADITVFDPRERRTLRRGDGESRAADCNLLFDGFEVAGRVHATIVNGALAYHAGEVVGAPGLGRIVRPGASTAGPASPGQGTTGLEEAPAHG
jgi:dihydroorotase (multifunctional complex type)